MNTKRFYALALSALMTAYASAGQDSPPAAKVQSIGAPMAHPKAVHTVALSPDGQYAATGADSKVRLWDAKSGKLRLSASAKPFGPPLEHKAMVHAAVFSKDGR